MAHLMLLVEVGMGYEITLRLDDVKLPTAKALAGLKALLNFEDDPEARGRMNLYSDLRARFGEIERGAADPLTVLKDVLEDEGFEVEVDGGVLNLVDWGEFGDGNSHNEGVTLAALGHLFEPGGSACGHGENGERWCYSFLGGRYELGWGVPHFYLSRQDRERVSSAWALGGEQIPDPLRGLILDLLERAGILPAQDQAA